VEESHRAIYNRAMTNPRLTSIVSAWIKAGRPAQESFSWSKSRSNWCRDIQDLTRFIQLLPESLSRSDVRLVCDHKKFTVSEKFVTAMIWGYGDLGYGSYRVKRMFSTPGFIEKIHQSFDLARSGKTLEAYDFLGRNKIQQLGPAFATKWLSFVSPQDQPAPIYDSFISLWIKKFASKEFSKVSTSSEVWSKKTYGAYLEWMTVSAVSLGVKADDLELVIFQDATHHFSAKGK
jgi:hypothetical protein